MIKLLRRAYRKIRLPHLARTIYSADYAGVPQHDPGPRKSVEQIAEWICDAQDNSASNDGGVARDYSLIKGWATSYPETTGYIIPTMIELGSFLDRPDLLERAKKMLDWCVSIQLPVGGFQGGKIDATPIVPVTFNTGQILLGLAAGAKQFDTYHEAMHRAARFLRDSLDPDGCWRRFPTPFAEPGEKAYETHVAWGLFEADRIAPDNGYGEAGLKQIRWALTKQEKNGWVRDCCLNQPVMPLTHTLGYYLRGLLEAYKWRPDPVILDAALRTANGLKKAQKEDGSLPGRVYMDWTPAVQWSCLTGNVQIAACWLELASIAGEGRLENAAKAANKYVRSTIVFDGPLGIRGGVKGSFPVDGAYGAFEYLNWAAKFTIDSNMLELADQTRAHLPLQAATVYNTKA